MGIFVADPDGKFLYANPRLQAACGLSEGDLLGTNFARVFPPEQSDEILADWLRIANTTLQQRVEQRIVSGTGENRWLEIRSSPFVSPTGTVLGRIGTVEDITDVRTAERELRESEERYRMLAEHATDVITTHAPDASCRYVSPSCHTLLGYEPAEMVGMQRNRVCPSRGLGEGCIVEWSRRIAVLDVHFDVSVRATRTGTTCGWKRCGS